MLTVTETYNYLEFDRSDTSQRVKFIPVQRLSLSQSIGDLSRVFMICYSHINVYLKVIYIKSKTGLIIKANQSENGD